MDGNLFTDAGVVSYWENDDGSFEHYRATYPEIVDIRSKPLEGWSKITVKLADHDELDFWVTAESGADRVFFELLRAT